MTELPEPLTDSEALRPASSHGDATRQIIPQERP